MDLIERLNELCERHEGVTTGIWAWDCGVIPPDGPDRYADIYADDTIIASFNDCIPEGKANAAAIADIPTMLAALREAATELARLTAELSALQSLHAAGSAPYDKEIERLQQRNAELTKELAKWKPDLERGGPRDPMAQWYDRATKAEGEVEALRAALLAAKRNHYTCEDCWFSCPKSGTCCNDAEGDECNCGADRHNTAIDAAID